MDPEENKGKGNKNKTTDKEAFEQINPNLYPAHETHLSVLCL